MHTSIRSITFALSIIAASAAATAAPAAPAAGVPAAEKARLIAVLEKKTGIKADDVEPSPLPGWYTMLVGGTLYYMEPTGNWLIDGHLVDTNTKTSVTAVRKAALAASASANAPKLDWANLNLADAILVKKGTSPNSRVIVTVEDPMCGACRALAGELKKVNDVTVYTFPVTFLGAASGERNQSIWCSKDRSAAWNANMAGQQIASAGQCDVSAIERNAKMARNLRVMGTPTMFFRDGTRSPGTMMADAIERTLASQPK